MPKNKVKYGLKNVYYALATISEDNGSASYEKPVRWPGAVSLSMDAQGDSSNFFADDGIYFTTTANNGYQGDLEMALISDSFRTDVLGEIKDKNGVMVEETEPVQKHFALLFEFQGDQNARRHVLYNCVASRPSVGSSTKAESVEVQTESVTVTSSPVYNESLDKNITKATADVENTPYATWYQEVYVPEKNAVSGE